VKGGFIPHVLLRLRKFLKAKGKEGDLGTD